MTATVSIRAAEAADHAVMDAIARAGDAAADEAYLDLVCSQHGRLLVAELDGAVVGFGGVVPVGDVLMLTDLFVAADVRGRGVGGELLVELFGHNPHRMTFSSKHEAALPAYQRAGMVPQWRLLYFVGRGRGGAAPPAPQPWRHERQDLVDALAARGAHVGADVVTTAGDDGSRIMRLQGDDPERLLAETLRSIDPSTPVRLCVPETDPLAAVLASWGFEVEDNDIWCATPGVELPHDLHVLDPGLA